MKNEKPQEPQEDLCYNFHMRTKFEVLKFKKGKIVIAKTGRDFSTGLLHLHPDSSLEKHNRPVGEQLVQVFGACIMRLYDGENFEEIELKEGDELFIVAKQFHMHTNPFDQDSITAWRFDGDITEVIKGQRKKLK